MAIRNSLNKAVNETNKFHTKGTLQSLPNDATFGKTYQKRL